VRCFKQYPGPVILRAVVISSAVFAAFGICRAGAGATDDGSTAAADSHDPAAPAVERTKVGFQLWQEPRPEDAAAWYRRIQEATEGTQIEVTVQNSWPRSLERSRFPGAVRRYAECYGRYGWSFQPRITTALTRVGDIAALDDWPENVHSIVADSEVDDHLGPLYANYRAVVPEDVKTAFPEGIGYGSAERLLPTQEFVQSWNRMAGNTSTGVWATFRAPTNISAIVFLAEELGAQRIKVGPQLFNTSFGRAETPELLRAGVFLAAQQALGGAEIPLDISVWGASHIRNVEPILQVIDAIKAVNALDIDGAEPMEGEVAVIWDSRFIKDANSIQVFWHMVFASGVEHDLLLLDKVTPKALSGYRAVVIPRLALSDFPRLPPGALAALEEYARGGRLVITECGDEEVAADRPAWCTFLPSSRPAPEVYPSIFGFFIGWDNLEAWPPKTAYRDAIRKLVSGYCELLDVPPGDPDVITRRFTRGGEAWLWSVDVPAGAMEIAPLGHGGEAAAAPAKACRADGTSCSRP